MAGFKGTFVISWSQTETDGLVAAPLSALVVGAMWRWHGAPVRVDGPNDLLVLSGPDGERKMRNRVARVARKLMKSSGVIPAMGEPEPEEPAFDQVFTVSDGHRTFAMTAIDMPHGTPPLLLFLGDIPPHTCDLWVVQGIPEPAYPPRTQTNPGVICFAKGTLLRTSKGARRVEDLCKGDLVETRDSGAQPVIWTAHRRIGWPQLHAMPDLRPIRLRSGALGVARPTPDLIVSPQHRILVCGAMAQALFNTDEVLVTAADLVNDRTVTVEHLARAVTYYHVMLPAHHVVWANGLACDSFHPAHAPLAAIPPEQRQNLLALNADFATDPQCFGDPARRMLTKAEAAILLHRPQCAPRHLAFA